MGSLLDQLYALLPDGYILPEPNPEPTLQTINTVKQWIYAQFEDIFDYINSKEGDYLDSSQIKDAFDVCISSTATLRENGWTCEIIDRKKNVISVYVLKRQIVVPRNRTDTKVRICELAIHEVFGHALRSALAEQLRSEVGQIGTETHQSFEEAFEIVLEQCFDGKYNPMYGVNHYLSVGMSLSSGKSKSDIAHFFNKVLQLQAISRSQKPINAEDAKKAHDTASLQVRRTFAGLTDVDKGIPHMKDIDYLHGTRDAWWLITKLVELNIVDEGMRWLLAAKFNPFNTEDRAMVEKFHPMPKSLRSFLNE